MTSWARRSGAGWVLAIHAQPGAKRSEVVGLHGDALKVRVAAPPLEGRANAAIEALIAEALGVAKNSVSVVRGGTSRRKDVLVSVPEIDPARLLDRKS